MKSMGRRRSDQDDDSDDHHDNNNGSPCLQEEVNIQIEHSNSSSGKTDSPQSPSAAAAVAAQGTLTVCGYYITNAVEYTSSACYRMNGRIGGLTMP